MSSWGFKIDPKDIENVKRWVARSKSHTTLYKCAKDYSGYEIKINKYIDPEQKKTTSLIESVIKCLRKLDYT